MAVIDIILLIPLLFGAYLGYKKGFLMVAVKIAALVLGVILGFKLIHWGAQLLAPHIGDANGFLPVISFLSIFIIVIVLVNMLGKATKKFLDMTLLGSVDNFAGAILNVAKWAFGLGLVLWLLEAGGAEIATDNAVVYPILVKMARGTIGFADKLLPFTSQLVEYIHNLSL